MYHQTQRSSCTPIQTSGATVSQTTSHDSHDDRLLEGFGYTPELKRVLKSFSSFAIVFSFISVSTGIFTTYGLVISGAGPRGIWSWPFVCAGQIILALVLAAVAGRIPISGLSYQWMSRLANPSFGWFVGWAFLGYGLITAPVVNYALVGALGQLLSTTWTTTAATVLVVGLTCVQVAILLISTKMTAHVNNIAVWTEVCSIAVFGVVLLVIGIFLPRGGGGVASMWSTGTIPASGYWYIFGPFFGTVVLGAFTFTGFDSAAALSDETQSPHKTVPQGIMRATLLSAGMGMLFLIGVTVAAKGNWAELGAASSPVGDIAQSRLGKPLGDVVIIAAMIAMFANSLIQTTVASRLVWSISRDRRFPASSIFHRLTGVSKIPTNAIILCLIIETLFAVFSAKLSQLIAASAMIPVGLICVAYLMRRHLYPVPDGGFSLGRWDKPVTIAAIAWSVILTVLLVGQPANLKSTEITVAIFVSGAVWWLVLRITRPRVLDAAPAVKTGDAAPKLADY
jgi:amino acid transporter